MSNIIILETAKRIHDVRVEKNLRAEEVAKRAGMHRSTYYRYEGGDQKTMRIEKIQKIAEVLGVYLADLIVWGDEKPSPLEGTDLDELDRDILKYLKQLSMDQKQMILAQLRVAIESQEAKQET